MRCTALLLLVVGIAGCASTPISRLERLARPVEAITITGTRNLDDAEVRITDKAEIDRIMELIHGSRTYKLTLVSWDHEKVKVAKIRIEHALSETELTMYGGLLRVPHRSDIIFYDIGNEAQKELWQLVLTHLGASDE